MTNTIAYELGRMSLNRKDKICLKILVMDKRSSFFVAASVTKKKVL
jgi:hypothetical protein